MEHDDVNNEQIKNIKYPCPADNQLTTINDCIYCTMNLKCDIYSTMLDEVAN